MPGIAKIRVSVRQSALDLFSKLWWKRKQKKKKIKSGWDESARAKEQRRLDLADFASACRLLLVGKIKNKFWYTPYISPKSARREQPKSGVFYKKTWQKVWSCSLERFQQKDATKLTPECIFYVGCLLVTYMLYNTLKKSLAWPGFALLLGLCLASAITHFCFGLTCLLLLRLNCTAIAVPSYEHTLP